MMKVFERAHWVDARVRSRVLNQLRFVCSVNYTSPLRVIDRALTVHIDDRGLYRDERRALHARRTELTNLISAQVDYIYGLHPFEVTLVHLRRAIELRDMTCLSTHQRLMLWMFIQRHRWQTLPKATQKKWVENGNRDTCVICLCDTISVMRCCGASCHRACIEKWAERNPSCPHCRAK